MKNIPDVTVLIAVHNCEKYIGRCIRSILKQTMPKHDYEIIVVNDGSGDRTDYALKLFEDEIRVINHSEKSGLPAALNTGIKAARGQYLVRLDGDDYVHTEYLNVLSLFLRMNKDIDAVACDYILVDDDENVLGVKNCLEEPVGCGIMFRMDHLIDIGMYDNSFKAREDEDLRIRFVRKYGIERVRLPLYRYRRHENNLTNNTVQMEEFKHQLNRKHGIR